MGYALLSPRPHHAAHRGPGRLENGQIDCPFGRTGGAFHNGLIAPDKIRAMEHLLHEVLRMGVAGDHHEAAGALVQPVHRPVGEILLIPIVIGHPVGQGEASLTGR